MKAMDETFLRYNALDSACTLEIHNKIWDDVGGEFAPAYQMTINLFPVLMFMQTRGVRVSHDLLDATKREVLASAKEKQEELDKIVGHHLNVNSPKQCVQYFYITKGISPYFGKGKSPTVDDKALQRMVRGTAKHPGLREAKLVQEIRGLEKLYGTYLNMQFDEDNRMRGSYNPRGTKFGRLSSSKTIFDTGMNFQNLPQEFKKFLVPDPGYAFVEVDKRQAEWVIVAYASGDANMMAAIESKTDVHVHTASLMFGVDADIIKLENKLIGHITDAETIAQIRYEDSFLRKYAQGFPRGMSARQCGKKSNHGLNYDEGFNGFALINEIEIPEAKRIVNMYHTIYPGIRLWYEAIKRSLQKDRSLTNCFGRKVRFMGQWGDDLFKSAYSMIPQSTVVDSLNEGMVKIYEDTKLTKDINLDILAQVHDSVLMQVPIAMLEDPVTFNYMFESVTKYTSPGMNYNGRDFTIASDFKAGLNWGGANDKHNPTGMDDITCHEDMLQLIQNWRKTDGSGTQVLA
jgi:DNA polymerase I-like protein with 3'-5' exonuclease and polymerase domains